MTQQPAGRKPLFTVLLASAAMTACTADSTSEVSAARLSTANVAAESDSDDRVTDAYTRKLTVKPFVSAHRGGAAHAPENTMVAYRNAARMGVDDFETDSTLTKDGKLVLIHDATLNRTTNCSGNVSDKTYPELLKCDAGHHWTYGQATTQPGKGLSFPYRGKGVTIPLAEELFAYARSLGPLGPTVTIEIKNIPGEAGFETRCPAAAAELVKQIAASGIRDRIIVQSFDPSCLLTVKQLDPAVQTLNLSFGTLMDNFAVAKAAGFTYASPSFSAPDFNAQTVAFVQSQGVKVNPYTLDQQADIEKGINLGLDGIITNYPACMLQLQKRPLPKRVISPELGPDVADANICPQPR